jgi:hypothetical protein
VVKFQPCAAFLFLFLASCMSSQIPIIRETVPVNRPEVDLQRDQTAIIRTPHCDISLRYLNTDDWSVFGRFNTFSSRRGRGAVKPPYEIFFFTIHSSTDKILRNIRFSVRAGTFSAPALARADLLAQCASSRYRAMNIEELFVMRRLIIPEYRMDEIDFDNDTIGYPFDFITMLDSVSLCVAVPTPPVEARRYFVSVEYTAGSEKKVVDFEIERREHRRED